MSSEFTPNFNLELKEFNVRGWHTAMNNNLRILDAILATAISISSFTGDWENSTLYAEGEKAVDTETGAIYTVLIPHTSASTGTFAEDRAAHPTYWAAFALEAESRGAWASGEDYGINDFVVSGYKYAVCVAPHTSGATFESDAASWEVLVDLTDAVAAAEDAAVDAAASAAEAAASAGTVIGFLSSVVNATGNASLSYSTQNGFLISVDASLGNVTITLPTASSSPGCRFVVKKVDASANTVTVVRAGSDTVEDGTGVTLANRYDSVTVMRQGSTNWSIVDLYQPVLSVNRGGTGASAGSASVLINLGMSTYAASTIAAVTNAAALQAALGFPAYGSSLISSTDAGNARSILGLSNPAVMQLQAIRTSFGTTYVNTSGSTAADTFNFIKANLPSGVDFIALRGVAAGGGGGAGDTSIPTRGTGGSGAEAGEIRRLAVASLADTVSIIIPGKANGGTSAGQAGASGGTLSFGTHMVLAGGTGGATSTGGAALGVEGGTSSHFGQSGVVAYVGGAADYKWTDTADAFGGGDSLFGAGGRTGPGANGVGYGAGGAGGNHSGTIAGGTGQAGFLEIVGVL